MIKIMLTFRWLRRVGSGVVVAGVLALPMAALGAAGGQGLEISPPVLQLSADPGATVIAKIDLRNITTGPLVVTGAANDFGARSETGEPQILLKDANASHFSLRSWIKQVPGATLQPNEKQTFSVPIVVPAQAEPGGHYAVIRFSGASPEVSGSGVSLSASLGTLVLLRVSGQVREGLTGAEFYVSHSGSKSHFFSSGPVVLSERLRNSGNVHVAPKGTLRVYNGVGKKVSEQSINKLGGNILPDTVRRFDQQLGGHLFGRYRATYDVVYGSGKQHLAGSTTFWVIPWKLILIILIAIAAVVGGLRFSIKRYNRYIIQQSKGAGK